MKKRLGLLLVLAVLFHIGIKAQCDGQATFTDSRGPTVYNQITIGTQCWMAENLNFDQNSFGNDFCYGDNAANCATHGRLYDWAAVMQGSTTEGVQGVCPSGWHVPANSEFTTMTETMGVCPGPAAGCSEFTGLTGTDEGDQLKQAGLCEGRTPCGTSGFNALMSGIRAGAYFYIGARTQFWSSSRLDGTRSYSRIIFLSNGGVGGIETDLNDRGFSVRCVRDLPATPLPIELLYFKANWEDDSYRSVVLTWETSSEQENSHFEIERSIDGINFQYVKSVDGNGTTNMNISYSTLDEDPYVEGVSYYRLKQVDVNGDYEYSNIEVLNTPDGLNMVSLFPNPSVNDVTILLTSSFDSKIEISVKNNAGQEVRRWKKQITKGFTSLQVEIANLSGGNYILEIKTPDGLNKIERKFIKRK